MAEALNGTVTAELIDRCRPWQTRPRPAIYEWISWYNHARIHTSIGDMPPIEYEHTYYSQLNHLHLPAPYRDQLATGTVGAVGNR